MPRTKTVKPEVVSAATASKPVVATPAAKKSKPAAEVAVAAPVETTAPTVDAEPVPEVADLSSQSAEFITKLTQMNAMVAALKSDFRTLQKKYEREIKTVQKTCAKRKRKSGNRAPSGFVKPTKISDELAAFLEKPLGSEMARTDVTREINKYIRAHNLQDKDNGRKIIPDTKLTSLLKLKKSDELTYFNLQRYMSPHFYKSEKSVTAPVVTV